MRSLPQGEHDYYAGIDPGFSGAIGTLNAAGTTLQVWDLPVQGEGKTREFSIAGLDAIIFCLGVLPGKVAVGLEWPTTRPGEGAERCERFGRGKGILETLLYVRHCEYHKISPNLWKARLGLPGKTTPGANKTAAALFDLYYPQFSHVIRGPRGGIKDGRLDALLIAHFLRMQTAGGLRSVVARFGKDSPEAMALVLGSGKKRHRKT